MCGAHYHDVIMGTIASQITSLAIVWGGREATGSIVANRCCVTFTEIRTLPLFVAQTARTIKIPYYIAYFTAILYGAPWRGPRMGASDRRFQLEWRSDATITWRYLGLGPDQGHAGGMTLVRPLEHTRYTKSPWRIQFWKSVSLLYHFVN